MTEKQVYDYISIPKEYEQQWRDKETGRIVKKIVDYPGFSEEYHYDEDGHKHSFNDKPAIITTYKHGEKEYSWMDHGCMHRGDDKPAEIDSHGTRTWYLHGRVYRPGDKPTVVMANGLEMWYNDARRLYRAKKGPVMARNGVPGYLESDEAGVRVKFTDGSVVYLDAKHKLHTDSGPTMVWADGTPEKIEYAHGVPYYVD